MGARVPGCPGARGAGCWCGWRGRSRPRGTLRDRCQAASSHAAPPGTPPHRAAPPPPPPAPRNGCLKLSLQFRFQFVESFYYKKFVVMSYWWTRINNNYYLFKLIVAWKIWHIHVFEYVEFTPRRSYEVKIFFK